MSPQVLQNIEWQAPVQAQKPSEKLFILQKIFQVICAILLYLPRKLATCITSIAIVPSSIGGTVVGKIACKAGLFPSFKRKSYAKMNLEKMGVKDPLLSVRQCELKSAQGKKIQATLLSHKDKPIEQAPTVIFFCPQQVSQSHWAEREMIKAHQKALESYGSINFLMVEYPRLPTGNQTMEAAYTAYDFVAAHLQVKPEDITVFGKSLGGFAAVQLAKEKKIGRLIVDRSGTSIMKTAEKAVPKLFKPLVRKLLKRDGWGQFETVQGLKQYKGEAYVIYHGKDQRFKGKLNLGNADLPTNVKKFSLQSDAGQKDYHSHRLRKGTLFNSSDTSLGNAEDLWLQLAFCKQPARASQDQKIRYCML